MTCRLYNLAICIFLLARFSPCQGGNIAKVLIFSRTVDFRHDSIPTAINALKQQGPSHNIQFDNTEDQTFFTDSNLSHYDALLFLSNTGQVLDDPGIQAFQNYVNFGGNFVATKLVRGALGMLDVLPLPRVGAHFRDHTNLQNATIVVLNSSHPSTNMLPQRWAVNDEMYHFKRDPRSVGAIVLLTADTSTFTDQTASDPDEGTPAPKAWYQDHTAGASAEGTSPSIGRSWYTSLGHLNETWKDSTFIAHVMGGVTWALSSNTTLAFNANAKVGNGAAPPLSGGPSPKPSTSSPPVAQSGNFAKGTSDSLFSRTAIICGIMLVLSMFL